MKKDEDNITDIPITKKCCCSNLTSCFKHIFNKSKTKSKKYFITKWREYLSKEVHNSKELNDPFELLTHLWAHKNVIHQLEDIRLNPNLLNKKQIRNDLEFYIPQLCSFMLFGEQEIVEEFFSFLCKSCFVSFSFAHRIIWFLKSSVGDDPKFNERIRNILHIIQTIFKSDKEKTIIEDFFLSGSKEYLDYYEKQGLRKDYILDPSSSIVEPSEKEKEDETLDDNQKEFYKTKATFRTMIDINAENSYITELERLGLNDNGMIKKKTIEPIITDELNPCNISLSLFTGYDYVTNDENNIHTQCLKQIDLDDVNLSSFLSNINFIDHLCNISDRLMYTNQSEQKKTLLNELKTLNKCLPSNVYLPFINSSMRNYVISSIPLSEAQIFKTKQRAPYMITIECFRLDELTYDLKYEQANDGLMENTSEKINNMEDVSHKSKDTISISEKIIESSENKGNKLDLVYHLKYQTDFFHPKKSFKKKNSMKEKYETILKTPAMFNNEGQESKDKNIMTKTMYLNENEVKYSKPIIIHNLIRRTGLSYINNSSQPSNTSSTSKKTKSLSKNQKEYDQLVANDYEASVNNPQENNHELIPTIHNISSRKCELLENTIKSTYQSKIFDNTPRIHDNGVSRAQHISQSYRTPKIKSIDFSIELSPNGGHDDLDDSKSDEEKVEENIQKSVETQGITENGNIFGETIEQMTERLRKSSPFGKLMSYKLFNMIVKSGEDLRQEQFATQLINEFLQIFKFSKVKCWLQPYEIIATGADVGIVEVVSNAISIDQMKKRSKASSLKEFYINYFGPVNSNRYKQAMNNYIESLAGYSLVCYFLQIKDRHNANIMIDNQGHLIHIDFGFMLSNAPGKGLKFEKAPFKLTEDFVDVMGGSEGKYFDKFRKCLWSGFIALATHSEKILILVEMMYCGHQNNLPCFENGQETINELRNRFIPRPNMKNRDYIAHVDGLISESLGNWRTKWYDKYQYYVQGILA